MDGKPPTSLSDRAPVVEAVRQLQVQMRDVAAAAAPDPFSFMTLYQAFLFQHLARSPRGLPLVTLVEALSVSAPAVSQMVGRMHANGLVEIEPHPHDSRCKLVVPTQKGYDHYAFVERIVVDQERQWVSATGRRTAQGQPSTLHDYAEAGLALWRTERSGGDPYATGWRAS